MDCSRSDSEQWKSSSVDALPERPEVITQADDLRLALIGGGIGDFIPG